MPTIVVEAEFSGLGAGWTDITADVRGDVPIMGSYGIQGAGLRDRVASTGRLTFALDNGPTNSGGLLGYYAPGHTNARAGFELGIRVRLKITHSAVTYYKFVGTLVSINPQAGSFGDQLTQCTVIDWMDEAARHKLNLLSLQVGKRGDELITAILANMTRQPAATSLATGQDTFAYAGDNWRDERTTALAAFQAIAMSELGFIYVAGDTTQGGELVFQDRHARPKTTASAATLNETMLEFYGSRSRDRILNRIKTTAHPREVDAAATTVLFSLRSAPVIPAGESRTIVGRYTDPNNRGVSRVGGLSMVAPVATTDYTMNSASDGTGTNLTASFTVVATYGANSASFVVTNTGAVPGYITKLQCRGKGVYDYEPTTYQAIDSTSKTAYGEGADEVDMPLQDSYPVAKDAGDYLLSNWKNPQTLIDRVDFLGSKSDANLVAGLACEPGSRVTITETATGLNRDFFIQAVDFTITPPDLFQFGWLVVPKDLYDYWILGTSTLGETTILGY